MTYRAGTVKTLPAYRKTGALQRSGFLGMKRQLHAIHMSSQVGAECQIPKALTTPFHTLHNTAPQHKKRAGTTKRPGPWRYSVDTKKEALNTYSLTTAPNMPQPAHAVNTLSYRCSVAFI